MGRVIVHLHGSPSNAKMRSLIDDYSSRIRSKVKIEIHNSKLSGEEYLGIFVHFMKGENDDILFWPWKGNIRFTLVNQQSGPRFVEK